MPRSRSDPSGVARRFLAWAAAHLEPADRAWIEAIAAEMDTIDGGVAQLAWAAGGLRLLWTFGRRDMTGAVRFWFWASCHGAVLGFMVLTSSLPDVSIVPVTLLYCVVAGFLTGLWTGRAEVAGMVGGTMALIAACVLFLAIGVTHRASLDTPWPVIVAGLAVAVPTFAALGFIGGAIGGAIASPVEAVRTVCRAAAEGPAWRSLQVLRRMALPRRS
jgi:hypothetical protein